ncbi:MAG: hypothetical protein HQ472_08025 [Ignavibacteria bacterium]|nr:hypothetical protein [Ignavibacteria bacterium]
MSKLTRAFSLQVVVLTLVFFLMQGTSLSNTAIASDNSPQTFVDSTPPPSISTALAHQPSKNPTTAVLYSLAFPGLGQFYNEQYWKIPIFTGTCVFTAYLFFTNNSNFNSLSTQVDNAVATGQNAATIQLLKSQRETYRDNRDVSGVVFLAAYALAAVDSYVGAHLFDFDVSDDLSLGMGPSKSSVLALNLAYRW